LFSITYRCIFQIILDVALDWGSRYPCGLHTDNNGAEKLAITLNKLYSSVDASAIKARAAVIPEFKDESVQGKFFAAMRSAGKLKGVAGRMENKVSELMNYVVVN
jgi:hypothetical protein